MVLWQAGSILTISKLDGKHPNSSTDLVICGRVTRFTEVLTHSGFGKTPNVRETFGKIWRNPSGRDNTLIFTMLSLSFA